MPNRDPSSTSVGDVVDQLTSSGTTTISVADRIRLCRQCLDLVVAVARDWTESAARAKGCPNDPLVLAEDLLSGPAVVLRQLQLSIQTLTALEAGQCPRLPGPVRRLPGDQLAVSVFPTTGFFDSLTFFGLSSEVRMQPGVSEDRIFGRLGEQAGGSEISGTSVVLGAGNVSSIPATDSLNRILFERRRVVLKMNPVNEYLAPLFQQALGPLIREDLLRIVTGDAAVGAALVRNERITDVHITGSTATHDAIVWGTDAAERQVRRQKNEPLINKPVTSELGNVTPWIVVPGQYSEKQLQSQAQHVAASITNNASFNCLATKVIVTWDQWEQRDRFLELLNNSLAATPLRPAYYPGAAERYVRFSGRDVSPDDRNRLPWTLLTGQSVDERPELFTEESFVCVCAETTLSADCPAGFLSLATEFVNERLTGTLCASVTVPPGFRRQYPQEIAQCLSHLRYGSVGVNQWTGLAYGLMSPPWGAYPGATLQNVVSGIGSVHNTYLLDNFEKTVLDGPLINFPKPIWWSAHREALATAERLLALYNSPSVLKLPGLFLKALSG
ncbi:MAG: aldehyde dehydrogenase family protein [Fuerstiella sp.]